MDQGSSFGALLRRLRVAAGLTQEALAERAGLSVRTVSDLERGVNRTPRKDTLPLLAEALALSAEETRRLQVAAQQATGGPAVLPGSPTVPLLAGRTQELILLERHLAGAGPPVLVLAGEPGIGKTRLLQEAAQQATQAGWQVVAGGCHRRGGQEPYAPLLDALHSYLARQTAVQQRTNLQGCAWLVRLLPELAEGPIPPLPPWTLSPEQERRLMNEAVVRFLANVAGPMGTLLLLDDLQWAGPDALDLLATLARSAPEVPLRIVGAYRDTEVQPEDVLSVMLGDLAHAGLTARRPLGPLAPEEAAQLLEGLLAGAADEQRALRERVLQRAGGVPFFVMSCAQALRLGTTDDGHQDAMPWDVGQSVRQRAAALPVAAREVLGVAALVGRVVPRALLAGVARRPEDELGAALEAACRARLLEEQGEAAYQFAHDVIREVVEADLGAARRTVLHRRIAEVLERGPGEPPVERLAYHYSRSEEQEKALLYLEQAGDRARVHGASAAAADYYQELVDRLGTLGRALDAAGVRAKLGAALRIMVRYDAALAVLEEAAQTYQAAGDLERLAHTVAQIGRVHHERMTPEQGLQRLQPLLAVLEPGGASRGLAMLYAWLAFLFGASGRNNEFLSAAERATELAHALRDDRTLAQAVVKRGNALFVLGRVEEARVVLEEAIPLAEAVGDLDHLCDALQIVGVAHSLRGEFATSWAYFERAREVATVWGDPTMVAHLMVFSGLTAFWQGNWEQARAYGAQAAAMSRQIGESWVAPYAVLPVGHLHLAEGTWEEASRSVEEAKLFATGHLDALRWVQGLLAERDLLEGHPDAARARLVPLLDRPGLEAIEVTTQICPRLAWAYLELGEVRQAEEMVAQCITRARGENLRLALVDALWMRAVIATRHGRWVEAHHALEEGLALARRMPYPYAEARLLHVYGDMHVQKGEPGLARQRLEAALALVRRLGARKDIERVEQTLADL